MRNLKCKRFGVHEVKSGTHKGGLHVPTEKYQEYHSELSYLGDYLTRRILPAEPEEVTMTGILINLVNVLDNEMEEIMKANCREHPSEKGEKTIKRINEGYVSYKEKFEDLFDKKQIDIIQYSIMEDLRKLRNKHAHYRLSKTRPKFKYLNHPLISKQSLRNLFVDCAFVLRHLRNLSGNKTKWQIIPPGYADELGWGNLQDIYTRNAAERIKAISNKPTKFTI